MNTIDNAIIARRKNEIAAALLHHKSQEAIEILQRAQVETDRTVKIARELHAAYEKAMRMEVKQWEEISQPLAQTDDSEVDRLLKSIQSPDIREVTEKSVMAERALRQAAQERIAEWKELSVELRNAFERLPSLLIGSLNSDILPPGDGQRTEAVSILARQIIGLIPVAGPVVGLLVAVWDVRRTQTRKAEVVDDFHFYWRDYIEAVTRWSELANIFRYPPGYRSEGQ